MSRSILYMPIIKPNITSYRYRYDWKPYKLGGRVKSRIGEWCFSLLRRWGALDPSMDVYNEVTSMQIEVNLENIERLICESREAMMCIYRREAEELIVGKPEWSMLKYVIDTQFPPGYQSHIKYQGVPLEYKGLRVRIVPWFSGLIVVPKGEEVVMPRPSFF